MSAAARGTDGARALLAALVVYLPLEEFLLKWVPGDGLHALLRVVPELLLFGTLAGLVAGRCVRGLAWPSTPIDRPLLAFVALALVSLLLSGGEWLGGLVNLRVLLRYVAATYVVWLLRPGERERRRWLGLVLAGAIGQGLIGLLQVSQGGAGEFWLPRSAALELGGYSREVAVLSGGIERGAVLGTTDHSVAFALFLLVAVALAAARLVAGPTRRTGLLFGVLALCALGILFSYARSCQLALVFVVLLLAWWRRRARIVQRFFAFGAALTPLILGVLLLVPALPRTGFAKEKETAVSPLESFTALFQPEYLEAARSARLWVLIDVGGTIVEETGWIGLGPDAEHVREELLRAGGAALSRLIAYRALEDVYWVALLAYYGFLGLALFLAVLWALVGPVRRVAAASTEVWARTAALALGALLVVVVPLSFLAPTFDFRTFAFYFWLLAGLVLVAEGELARARELPARAGGPV